MLSEAPRLQAGLQKRLTLLLTTQPYIPPLVKGGEGGFVDVIIIKFPLIPLFQRGKYKRKTFHPRLQNGVFKFIFHKLNFRVNK
jgi:hypothetical protein